jgi:hypothetical protein
MVPLCIRIRCVNEQGAVILGLVGLLPQLVILAMVLRLLGWSWLFDWLVIIPGANVFRSHGGRGYHLARAPSDLILPPDR